MTPKSIIFSDIINFLLNTFIIENHLRCTMLGDTPGSRNISA